MNIIERWRFLQNIKSLIKDKSTQVTFNTNVDSISEDFDMNLVERYDIIPNSDVKHFNKRYAGVVSLTRTEDLFFTDFSLKLNGNDVGFVSRQVRKLYEMAHQTLQNREKISGCKSK